jgi:hypothetical protein
MLERYGESEKGMFACAIATLMITAVGFVMGAAREEECTGGWIVLGINAGIMVVAGVVYLLATGAFHTDSGHHAGAAVGGALNGLIMVCIVVVCFALSVIGVALMWGAC